jgi:hypothetical protein
VMKLKFHSEGREAKMGSDLQAISTAEQLDSSQKLFRCIAVAPLYRRWCCLAMILPALWYLLLPPFAGDSGVNSRAPVSDWSRAGTYNSQDECQTAKNAFAATIARLNNAGQNQAQNMLSIELSRCLAADDYRLEAAQNPGSQNSAGQNSTAALQQQSPKAQP